MRWSGCEVVVVAVVVVLAVVIEFVKYNGGRNNIAVRANDSNIHLLSCSSRVGRSSQW